MHSSRMRTARPSPYRTGLYPGGLPDRPPPRDRDPSEQRPQNREPPGQRVPGHRPPIQTENAPWTETTSRQNPPPPGTWDQRQRHFGKEHGTRQEVTFRPPPSLLWTEWQTCKYITLPQTSFVGGTGRAQLI